MSEENPDQEPEAGQVAPLSQEEKISILDSLVGKIVAFSVKTQSGPFAVLGKETHEGKDYYGFGNNGFLPENIKEINLIEVDVSKNAARAHIVLE